MPFESLSELHSFVNRLDVPEERREVVEAELLDHFFEKVSAGSSERDALAALGEQAVLRVRFERAERGFEVTVADAVRDGLRLAALWLVASFVAWELIGRAWLYSFHHPYVGDDRVGVPDILIHLATVGVAIALSLPPRSRGARIRASGKVMLVYGAIVGLGGLAITSDAWLTFLAGASNFLWRGVYYGWGGSSAATAFGLIQSALWGPAVSIATLLHFRGATVPGRRKVDA